MDTAQCNAPGAARARLTRPARSRLRVAPGWGGRAPIVRPSSRPRRPRRAATCKPPGDTRAVRGWRLHSSLARMPRSRSHASAGARHRDDGAGRLARPDARHSWRDGSNPRMRAWRACQRGAGAAERALVPARFPPKKPLDRRTMSAWHALCFYSPRRRKRGYARQFLSSVEEPCCIGRLYFSLSR
jgi:hypothetical protein